jgi:hypothetical protein
MKMIEDRISKREIAQIYNVNLKTIDNWNKERGLPLIKVSTHSQFTRLADLRRWEDENTSE